MSVEGDIRRFHDALGIRSQDTPGWPDHELVELRIRLLEEEFAELIEAMRVRGSLADVAKEICDLVVVAVGAAVALGIPFDRCFEAVHASNMAKQGGPMRADGKVLKPAGWQPPDLAAILGD